MIAFEKGETFKTIAQGDKVTVWLKLLYNQKEYDILLDTSLVVNKISNYQYEITGDLKGFNTINLSVINKAKTKVINSNSLLLVVL